MFDALRAFNLRDHVDILSTSGDVDADHALALGISLRDVVHRVEQLYRGQLEWNRGRLDRVLNFGNGEITSWPPEAVEKMAAIDAGAAWFEKVGRFGFGVHFEA